MDIPIWLWVLVFGLIGLFLAIDLFTGGGNKELTKRQAWTRSIIWISVGAAFGLVILAQFGPEFAQQYWSGFVTEKALSIDNVFVWVTIFTTFAIPRIYQQRILFLGIIGALVLRAIFIVIGASLIKNFAVILYVFAAFLLFTGVKMLLSRGEEKSPLDSKFWGFLNSRFRATNFYFGNRFLVRLDGKLFMTPLLAVLALVEFTDVLFAVDSIPAVFAVTSEPFLVFTANAFALLGLRALYFVLADLMHRFAYLKVGLALILVWVGLKMALHDLVKVPTLLSLSVIIAILVTSIVASIIITKGLEVTVHESEREKVKGFEEAGPAEIAKARTWLNRPLTTRK